MERGYLGPVTPELAERNAREIIKHNGNCSEADLTCYTCPISVQCLKGTLSGKNRTEMHANRKHAAELVLEATDGKKCQQKEE
jgi:hypothetical protein